MESPRIIVALRQPFLSVDCNFRGYVRSVAEHYLSPI